MAQLTWSAAVETIQPHVVRISTPRGSGSGFLISNAKNNTFCGIATVAHVIDHAHYWEEPIRIEHVHSGKSVVVRRHERAVLLDSDRDTAAILLSRGDLPFPPDPLALVPKDSSSKWVTRSGGSGFRRSPRQAFASLRET